MNEEVYSKGYVAELPQSIHQPQMFPKLTPAQLSRLEAQRVAAAVGEGSACVHRIHRVLQTVSA
jgi:hypothetical protein